MPELPTGTVTFLFTDVEGSTRLWEEFPEAMQSALARHDDLLREAVEAHGGYIVKTTGDGVHAAFATAADAVATAIAGQLALRDEDWDPIEPLRVRMGVHTGVAEVRDGDYYGGTVNRAARLMAIAHGDQIVVSLATTELVRDDDYELIDLGEHRLRDLGRAERVFQLTYPGLPSTFGALRALGSFPTNLPLQVTSFVGRSREVEDVMNALDESRVVTLTGVGGVGKTRLALQVGAPDVAFGRRGRDGRVPGQEGVHAAEERVGEVASPIVWVRRERAADVLGEVDAPVAPWHVLEGVHTVGVGNPVGRAGHRNGRPDADAAEAYLVPIRGNLVGERRLPGQHQQGVAPAGQVHLGLAGPPEGLVRKVAVGGVRRDERRLIGVGQTF